MKQLNENTRILVRNNRKSINELYGDETIFSLANGSLGTRGHFIEGYGKKDYPQTLINGIYNTYPFNYEENYKQFPQKGQTIVLLPDASYIKIETEDGILNLTNAQIVSMKRSLDMEKGVTIRETGYKTESGFEFLVKEEKVLSSNQNIIIARLTIETINYFGKLKLSSYLKMPPYKKNETGDPRLPQGRKHLEFLGLKCNEDSATLKAKTIKTNFHINSGMTHTIKFNYQKEAESIRATHETLITPKKRFQVTKYQLYSTSLTSRNIDQEIKDMINGVEPIEQYIRIEEGLREEFWLKNKLEISDKNLEASLLYNIYQLNQSAGMSSKTSIASKGITGEGYEGHYFWDTEIYMLPYFTLTQPQKAKKLLIYRYLTLDESRKEAKNLGVSRGAKIAWRTINGFESSPYYPAGSAQIHINSDIALAIINYYYTTLDQSFMFDYGLEILVETAVFILDYGHFKNDAFHLDAVTGPDEYTTVVNDNYYTNAMAKMHFEFTCQYIEKHKSKLNNLLKKLKIDDYTLEQMNLAARKMTLLIDEKKQIIKQDSSFMEKKELDLGSIPKERYPLLLHYHPLFIYKHQILKQADAVLAMVILDEKNDKLYNNTFNYYLKRTTHDSSLSKCFYGIAAYHLGKSELAYTYFKEIAALDFNDHKNHTQHGLHVANLGGSYLMLVYGLFGVRIGKYLSINPAKQKQIEFAEIKITYQGSNIKFKLEKGVLSLNSDSPLKLKVYGKIISVIKKYSTEVKY